MSPSPLPGFLAHLAPILDNYGYLAVGGLILVEDFGVPSPGETILIAASVYAGAGRLNIVAVGLIAVLAAIVGDNIGYAIGRFGGHALVLRFGKYVFITHERLDKAERFFARYGGQIVVIARFIEGLRQLNGIMAGIAEMPWLRFLAFNALGAALWVGVWSSAGYLAGNHIGAIYDNITRYSLYLLIALVVLLAAWVVRAVWRRRRAPVRAAVDHQAPEPEAADHRTPEPKATNHQASVPKAAGHRTPEPEAADHQDPERQAADHRTPEPKATNHQASVPKAADPKDPVPEAADHKEL